MNPSIRRAHPGDHEHFARWIQEEGWEGYCDETIALDVSLSNVRQFVAEYPFTGQPVAVVTAVLLAPNIAYIGLYMVQKEHRDQDFSKLWNTAVLNLARSNVFLDTRVTMSLHDDDFPVRSPIEILRYVGHLQADRLVRPPEDHTRYHRVSTEADIANWGRYHEKVAGYANRQFWNAWHRVQKVSSIIAQDEHGVTGIGSVLDVGDKVKIGPLYAQNFATALHILYQLLSLHPGVEFILNIPNNNRPMLQFAIRHELRLKAKLCRSFSKRLQVTLDSSRCFSVTREIYQPD